MKISTFDAYITEQEARLLQEGLIKSYPIQTLKMQLFRKFRNNIDDWGVRTCVGGTPVVLTISLNLTFTPEEQQEFQKILDLCGYHVGVEQGVSLQIEPKFPMLVNSEDLPEFAYHITKGDHLDSITEIGLTPRNSQTLFHHPGNRIYLFVPGEEKDVQILKTMLHNVFSVRPPKSGNPLITHTLKVRLTEPFYYLDYNLEKGDVTKESFGMFTFRNIAPQYIEVVD